MTALENGLTVIHQQMSATPVVVVDVWVRAGARAEPPEWSGMAHFLEHMIFKGTDQLLPGMFDYAIETRGGLSNAATSHDYAHFYMTVAADALPETLPYLAELVLHAAIPADEFVRERQVVLEEILQAQDDPDWLGMQALSEQIFPDHPYGRPVLGTQAHLEQFSPEAMRCFHQGHYQPHNMAVVVTGSVPLSTTLALIRHSFRAFAPPSACPQNAVTPLASLREVTRQTLPLPQLQQARLLMAWTGPGVTQLDDACGMDLLSVLLAEGQSARLVRELREERQWVLDIGSGFSLQQDASLFMIQAWLTSNRLEDVEALVRDRIAGLIQGNISERELARAKRLLCNDFAFSTETPGQLAGLYGYYSVVSHPEASYTYPARIQAHTPASLTALAARCLTPDAYAVTRLVPSL